jgi:hypothetical protein
LSSSKCLTYRKKELKVAYVLRLATACSRQLISGDLGVTFKQFVECSLKTYKAWRIDAVSQVKPDWAHGSFVSDAKSDSMNHVVEVLEIMLAHTEGEAAEAPEDVSGVVKDYAVDVFPE